MLDDNLKLSISQIQELWDNRPKKAHKIKLFGKEYDTPRLQEAFGRSYCFSGTTSQASKPIPEMFQNHIKFLKEKYDVDYNMVLINWYRDDYISMHSDNEKQIKKNTPVATLSLGIEREFILQNKTNKEKNKFVLENNSVFVMGGTCQTTHKHGINKKKNIDRYRSVTFREFL